MAPGELLDLDARALGLIEFARERGVERRIEHVGSDRRGVAHSPGAAPGATNKRIVSAVKNRLKIRPPPPWLQSRSAVSICFADPESNAIDWASRPDFASPLKGKPALIVTAAPGLFGGLDALLAEIALAQGTGMNRQP